MKRGDHLFSALLFPPSREHSNIYLLFCNYFYSVTLFHSWELVFDRMLTLFDLKILYFKGESFCNFAIFVEFVKNFTSETHAFFMNNAFFQFSLSVPLFLNKLSLERCLGDAHLPGHFFMFSIVVSSCTPESIYVLSIGLIFHNHCHSHYY